MLLFLRNCEYIYIYIYIYIYNIHTYLGQLDGFLTPFLQEFPFKF